MANSGEVMYLQKSGAEWALEDSVLARGVLGINSTTREIAWGNGVDAFSLLNKFILMGAEFMNMLNSSFDPIGAASSAMTVHLAASDPHAQYTTSSEVTSALNALGLGTAATHASSDFAAASHSHSNATGSAAGFMASADKAKLDAYPDYSSRSQSSPVRSTTTSTGATGFQPSSSKDALVHYSCTIITTATIGGASSGTIVLEIAPTNSATAGDWVEKCRMTNGQTITLAVALQSVQTIASTLSCMVPSGYYAKLRSINNSGTPTYAVNSTQEVLL